VERFIAQSDPAGAPFDLVFTDPPFPFKKRAELLEKLASSALLAPEAVILIHYPAEDPLPQSVPGLQLLREKRYGRSMVRFLALLS
jgi:16S rRNA G966 N2-methylase RsmD